MKKRRFSELVWNVLATYGLSLFWVIIAVATIAIGMGQGDVFSGIPKISAIFHWIPYFPSIDAALASNQGLALFMTLVFAPLIEEAVFRMLPLTIWRHDREKQVAAIIVVCGIFFGLAHGHPLNVFVQGFLGMMLGFLYVRNRNSMLSGYLSCVAVHFMYNWTILMVRVLNG